MTAALILPSLAYEQSYDHYIVELGDEERYPFPLDFDYRPFGALLQRLQDFAEGNNIPDGYVPSSTFWLVEGGEILGVSNLRHRLNQRIRKCGGHIGLGIRPSYRGRGLSHVLMALTIQEARKRGISALHLHCHKDNEASARMILRNGGLLDSEIDDGQPAKTVLRFIVSGG